MNRYSTYTKLSGEVLDLAGLTDEEREHLAAAYAAYRDGTPWAEFGARYVYGAANPLVKAAGGAVTREVWTHPLFRAVRDLFDRLGIQQGMVGTVEGYELDRDPLADEWIPATEAATRKGVARSGLHHAIKRGDLVARSVDSRYLVSVRSLESWRPSQARQAAKRRRSA